MWKTLRLRSPLTGRPQLVDTLRVAVVKYHGSSKMCWVPDACSNRAPMGKKCSDIGIRRGLCLGNCKFYRTAVESESVDSQLLLRQTGLPRRLKLIVWPVRPVNIEDRSRPCRARSMPRIVGSFGLPFDR